MKRRFQVLLVLLACLLLPSCSSLPGTVVFEGTSMLPTIKHGERLRTQRLNAQSKARLVRGEIVVVKYPKDPTKRYIKRLIGLPGDTVEILSGEVWINDIKLSEPYVDSQMNRSPQSQPAMTVPARSYYVLGDNRDNSSDSRAWGFVPEELLMAKVVDR